MVSRERALEAVRAAARGVEKGELLSFLHETSDQVLGGWDIGDEDNETIYGFIRREAQRKAQREDRGSMPAAAGLMPAAAAAAAGSAGVGSAAEAGEADVRATIKKRAPCSAKYAAHLVVPASPTYKEAATVVGPHHVATYAHEGHLSWQCEQTVPVAVHCPDEDRRTHVDATVVYHDKDKDVAILEVQRELAAPVLDTAISAGDMYYVHGQSTQAQADATSISHGMVAATELDKLSHIRGDIISGQGDSGGGCFSVATGKLMAMVVGADGTTQKAVLVPIAVISSILTDLAAQRRLREQHPGCAA